MTFFLAKPDGNGAIPYSPVFCAPGALGFFGEGYPWHRAAKFAGMTFEGVSFVAKTATLRPLEGNMPLKKDGLTPKELFPKCIKVYPRSGHMLNAVGLSNMGFWNMLSDGRWQNRRDPFMISFMPKGADLAAKLQECEEFVRGFMRHYLSGKYGIFSAEFSVQINFACPNTGENPLKFIVEVNDVGKVLQPLREAGIPLVANFNALVPVQALKDAEPFFDAFWIANTIPWGTPGIDWTKFASRIEDGKPVSPLRDRGIPADGGLSGPDCFKFTVEKLVEAKDSGVSRPIIAGNGLQSPEQVDVLRLAGASAVAFGSVALVRPKRTGPIIARALEVFSRTDSSGIGKSRPRLVVVSSDKAA